MSALSPLNEDIAPEKALEERFRHGGCYAMAYALARRLGWSVEALIADMRPTGGSRHRHVVHAWVTDGNGRCLDVAGWFERR